MASAARCEPPSVVCNERGTVVFVNAAWTTLCGYTREEMMERNLKILQGPATDQLAVRSIVEATTQKQPSRTELVNYDRHGVPFKHMLCVVPLPSPDGSPCLFRATSEQVQLLRTPSPPVVLETGLSVDLRGDTMDAAFDLPWSVLEGVEVLTQPAPPFAIVWASEGWLELCAFSFPEVVGRTHAELIQGPATDRAAIARLAEACLHQRPIDGLLLVNYDRLRQPFRHTLSVRPVRSRACGAVTGLLATSRDVCPLHRNRPPAVPDADAELPASASLDVDATPFASNVFALPPALQQGMVVMERWPGPAPPPQQHQQHQHQHQQHQPHQPQHQHQHHQPHHQQPHQPHHPQHPQQQVQQVQQRQREELERQRQRQLEELEREQTYWGEELEGYFLNWSRATGNGPPADDDDL